MQLYNDFLERCEIMLKKVISLVLAILVIASAMSFSVISTFAAPSLDAEFESALDAEGFPESYRPMLRELHAKYPKWKFTALKTGLDFNTVVEKEYILGDSLIDKTASPAWKSYDSGRYDFSKSTFATFDGGAYHAASKEYLAYCIDPRNFLTDTNALMFWVAYGTVGETEAGVNTILSGLNWTKTYPNNNEVVYVYDDNTYDIIINNTLPDGSEFNPSKTVKEKIEIISYGKAFYAAYKITGISAYMMASRIRQEQGVNGNISGMGKVPGYEGYYNLWNINTYGENKYVKGAEYAKEQGWDTLLKSIIGGATEKLYKKYFQQGQDTLYLHTYDVVKDSSGGHLYWHEYMTYLPAPWNEAAILRKAFTDETIQNEYVFKIPIYNNMPSSAVPCPSANGTNNNYLKSIIIGGKSISNFSVYTQTYTDIIVSNPSTTIDVVATPYDSGAVVSGAGNLNLQFGVNNISITVTASNGSSRKYNLSIVLNEGPADVVTPGVSDTTINPETYLIGDYITKIEPNTTIETFKTALNVKNGTVKVFGQDDFEKSSADLIATGDKVVVYDAQGNEHLKRSSIIYGDGNSDGKITSIDLLKMQRFIVGLGGLTEIQTKAADVNKDNKLNSVDLLHTQRYIVGLSGTLQGE